MACSSFHVLVDTKDSHDPPFFKPRPPGRGPQALFLNLQTKGYTPLGFLVNPDAKASKTKTLENYAAIFSTALGLFPDEYARETIRIVKLFRHGIMHQVFPKASGIGKGHADKPLVFASGHIPNLNLDRFTMDTVACISRLRAMLADDQYDALASQMNGRLDLMSKEDFETLIALS